MVQSSWSFQRLQNPARRGGEVVDDRVGGDARRRPAFLDGAGSGPDENRARTGGAPELHVNPFVADHKRDFRGDFLFPFPHLGQHAFHLVVFHGNRTVTILVTAVAVLCILAAWRTGDRLIFRLALGVAMIVPAQIVIGGITVLTDLNPWVVSLHLVLSLAIVSLAVLFLYRLDHPPGPLATGVVPTLAWTAYVVTWAVLYAGTVVTGSGPHAGDASSPRNGLDPLQVSQFHADLVFLLIGLTVGLWFALRATGGDVRPVAALAAVEVMQAVVGFVQYFADLPIAVVMLHMLGAGLVIAASAWQLVSVVQPASAVDRESTVAPL